MPYGQEATEFTKQLTSNKEVTIKLLRKDQYDRVVASVRVHDTCAVVCVEDKDVSLELVKNGLAFLYTGKGSEYDGNKILFEDGLGAAKKEHRGLWRNGENVLTPAEYKRLYSNQ